MATDDSTTATATAVGSSLSPASHHPAVANPAAVAAPDDSNTYTPEQLFVSLGGDAPPMSLQTLLNHMQPWQCHNCGACDIIVWPQQQSAQLAEQMMPPSLDPSVPPTSAGTITMAGQSTLALSQSQQSVMIGGTAPPVPPQLAGLQQLPQQAVHGD